MLYRVPAGLDVGSLGPGSQSGLGNLHGSLLVLDTLLEKLNVLLHVKDLLQNLKCSNNKVSSYLVNYKPLISSQLKRQYIHIT